MRFRRRLVSQRQKLRLKGGWLATKKRSGGIVASVGATPYIETERERGGESVTLDQQKAGEINQALAGAPAPCRSLLPWAWLARSCAVVAEHGDQQPNR